MREVKPGDTLPNGAKVLLASPIKGNTKITIAYQVVLCKFDGKYVTWSWKCVEEYAGMGNYFDPESLAEATEDFKIRFERADG